MFSAIFGFLYYWLYQAENTKVDILLQRIKVTNTEKIPLEEF